MNKEQVATKRENKYKWCTRILALTAIILFMRLFDLQILRGDDMRRLSEQNRVRVKKILAPRGMIFDRNGKIMADTRPSYNLYLIQEDITDFNQTVDGLAKLLEIDREEIVERIRDARGFPASFPVKIRDDMSMDQVAKVEANRIYMPGVSMQIEPKRSYPFGSMGAHMLGYVSEISPQELKDKKRYKGYVPGDTIGKFGLERAYENYLRGVDGENRVEVDATGREVRVLDTKEPISGNSLYLNIDMDVQAAVETAFEGKKGGCVVTDPKTGGVIVLVSKPAFDPNQLSSGVNKEYWKQIATDKLHPLQNRAIQGRFPPGSTFKILVALRGLEKGLVNERTSFSCSGGFPFGNRVFKCWKKGGHGSVAVHRAIVESCDVYFYNLGLKMGVDGIHEMAEEMGLAKTTGIDLPGEKAGLVPSTAWKQKTYKDKWYEGETVSVSIGQGAVWLTPIQLMQLSAFVANEGVTFKPQIVNRIVSPKGQIIKTFDPVMKTNVKISKQTMTIVRDAMKGVVNEPGGTAGGSKLPDILMSGKTGTAQSVGEGKGGHGDHAWFIAFAPSDDAKLAMAIVVEHGGHGSSTAAPFAKIVTETYMKRKTPTELKQVKLDVHR
jgi:penicillin-binding protein 2